MSEQTDRSLIQEQILDNLRHEVNLARSHAGQPILDFSQDDYTYTASELREQLAGYPRRRGRPRGGTTSTTSTTTTPPSNERLSTAEINVAIDTGIITRSEVEAVRNYSPEQVESVRSSIARRQTRRREAPEVSELLQSIETGSNSPFNPSFRSSSITPPRPTIDFDHDLPSEYYQSLDKLTPTQKTLVNMFNRNKRKFAGLRVVVASESGGTRLHPPPQGIVVKLPQNLMDNKFEIHLDNGQMYKASFWQIDLPKALKAKQPKPDVKSILEEVVKNLNYITNTEYQRVENDVKRSQENLKYHTETVRKTEIQLGKYEERLKNSSLIKVDEKQLAGELEDIRKHDQIKEAYITRTGDLFVKTKMLYKTDHHHKVDRSSKMGEFLFTFLLKDMGSTSPSTYIRAHNLTYGACTYCIDGYDEEIKTHEGEPHDLRYGHPYLDGDNICFGAHAVEIYELFQHMELYRIVDFLTLLFAVYPDEEHRNDEAFFNFKFWTKHKSTENIISTPDIFKEEEIKWPMKK